MLFKIDSLIVSLGVESENQQQNFHEATTSPIRGTPVAVVVSDVAVLVSIGVVIVEGI